MFERIGRGWGIAKASWAVIKLHPKLLLLPIFSGLAFVVLMAAIGLSVFAGAKSDTVRHFVEDMQPDGPVAWALLFAFYFVCTFIIIFFNAALIFCALQSFAGKEPSLRAGIRHRRRTPAADPGVDVSSPRRSASSSMRCRAS